MTYPVLRYRNKILRYSNIYYLYTQHAVMTLILFQSRSPNSVSSRQLALALLLSLAMLLLTFKDIPLCIAASTC